MKETLDNLLNYAIQAAKQAYSPYSGYKVGSAVLTSDGHIFSGCNIENASYSLTLCAERVAIFKAISEGFKEFSAIAIYVDSDTIFPPCGACRQVLAEFNPKIEIIYANRTQKTYTDLSILLPGAFSLNA